MPSFSFYKTLLNAGTNGAGHLTESNMIMTETWNNDIASVTAYLYDWEHDTHMNQLDNLNPLDDEYKVPMDIKFLAYTSQTYSKDEVTYHLQMKPDQDVCVDYYETSFANRYGAHFPVGLYADIQDSKGNWNRWLVVAEANSNDLQFPTYEILRCNHIVQYVYNNTKYTVPSVLRRSSDSSDITLSGTIETAKAKRHFVSPMNRETEKIFYNQRILLDNYVLTEPMAWRVTKVNRVSAKGVVDVDLYQDKYNANTDLIEKDSDGNVIGLWADYYTDGLKPSDYDIDPVTPPTVHAVISCMGTQDIKVGGSYKKLTVNFFDGETPSEFISGTWQYFIGDDSAAELISTADTGTENQIKIKFIGNGTYIGKTLTVKYITDDESVVTSLDLIINSL